MISYRNTSAEITESGADIAIIPVGSVEQHSTHLPIGTDCMLAEAFARAVAERINGILFPVTPVSTCYEHKGKKGNLWMRPITFYQMIQDLVLCLHTQGINKVAFIPGHGGIFVAPPAVRELNAMYDDLQVLWVSPERTKEAAEVLENKGMDIHSGESETSLMLYLHEDLVNKELMMGNDCNIEYPQTFLNYAPIHKLGNTGAWGMPSLAAKEKGEILFNASVNAMVDYINTAFEVGLKNKW